MSEIIGDTIVNAELLATQGLPYRFATVGAVYSDGISLIFDGSDAPTEKHYKCNISAVFKAGDRVKLASDSGTYIVEYPIGYPT